MTTTQDRQIAHRLIKLQLNPMVMMGSPFNLTMLNWGALLANHRDDEVAIACLRAFTSEDLDNNEIFLALSVLYPTAYEAAPDLTQMPWAAWLNLDKEQDVHAENLGEIDESVVHQYTLRSLYPRASDSSIERVARFLESAGAFDQPRQPYPGNLDETLALAMNCVLRGYLSDFRMNSIWEGKGKDDRPVGGFFGKGPLTEEQLRPIDRSKTNLGVAPGSGWEGLGLSLEADGSLRSSIITTTLPHPLHNQFETDPPAE